MKYIITDRRILFYAFKYSLGRMSFAPVTTVNCIKHNISKFSKEDLDLFIKEIEECKNYGMDFDKAHWLNFLNYLKKIKNKNTIQFGKTNDIIKIERDILIYAFRYSLFGSDLEFLKVAKAIENNIDNISEHDIKLFIREIEYVQNYGIEYDKEYFPRLIRKLEKSLEIRY